MVNLKVIDSGELEEAILSHVGLSQKQQRCDSRDGNDQCFQQDYDSGALDKFRGTYVAYQKGILCGQSKARPALVWKASGYYGTSSLTVFRVPERKLARMP